MGMTAQLLYSGAEFVKDLMWYVYAIMAVAEVLMVLYAVYIGYLFATASDEGKRRTAKSRLLKVLSSCLIIVALVSVMSALDITLNPLDKSGSGGKLDDVGTEIGSNQSMIYPCNTMRPLKFKYFTERGMDGSTLYCIYANGEGGTTRATFYPHHISNPTTNAALGRNDMKYIANTFKITKPTSFPRINSINLPEVAVGVQPLNGTYGSEIRISYAYKTKELLTELPCLVEDGKYYVEGEVEFELTGGGKGKTILKIEIVLLEGQNAFKLVAATE